MGGPSNSFWEGSEMDVNYIRQGADPNGPSTPTAEGCVFIMLLASIVELAQAARWLDKRETAHSDYGDGELIYAVIVGAVSLATLLFMFVLQKVQPDVAEKCQVVVAVFLFVWWLPGTIVLTFVWPFTAICNGFVSTWICFLSAAYLFYLSVPGVAKLVDDSLAEARRQKSCWLVFLASIVELGAACSICMRHGNRCTDSNAWAVAVGVVSCLITGLLLVLTWQNPASAELLAPFVAMFCALWAFGVSFTTFDTDAPFNGPFNGWVSVWIAFAASMHFVYIYQSSDRGFKKPNFSAFRTSVSSPAKSAPGVPDAPVAESYRPPEHIERTESEQIM